MSSPFSAYNPFLRPSRSVRSQNIGMPRIFNVEMTNDQTTTDTTNGVIVTSGTARVDGGQLWLLTLLQVHLKHTVASASVRVSVELYNGSDVNATPSATVWTAEDDLSTTAGKWRCFNLTGHINFAPVSWSPGIRFLQVRCTPLTAGTLTVGNSSAFAFDHFSAFVLGAIA